MGNLEKRTAFFLELYSLQRLGSLHRGRREWMGWIMVGYFLGEGCANADGRAFAAQVPICM
jgi:hypothetical protein